MILNPTEIQIVTWCDAEAALRAIRTSVFIVEQCVIDEFEWDDLDATAIHLLAMVNQQAVGCARVFGNKIGRMAVLKACRGKGIGMALLKKSLEIIKNKGAARAYLSAQTHAIRFYQQAGFTVISVEYFDVNIPHVDMEYQFVK